MTNEHLPTCDRCGCPFEPGIGGEMVRSERVETVVVRQRGPHTETEQRRVTDWEAVCDAHIDGDGDD